MSNGQDSVRFKKYIGIEEVDKMIFKLEVCDFCSGFKEKNDFEFCQKYCPLKDKEMAKEHENRLIEFFEIQSNLVQWAIANEFVSPGGNYEIEYNILEPDAESQEATYLS